MIFNNGLCIAAASLAASLTFAVIMTGFVGIGLLAIGLADNDDFFWSAMKETLLTTFCVGLPMAFLVSCVALPHGGAASFCLAFALDGCVFALSVRAIVRRYSPKPSTRRGAMNGD